MKKQIVIHPLLFALHATLALYAYNIAFVDIEQIVRPLVITAVLVELSFFLLSIVLKNRKKAGLIISLFVLLFFSYGHFFRLTENLNISVKDFAVGPHTILFSLYGLILIAGTYFSIRTGKSLTSFTKILNVVATCLVLIPVITIGIFKIKTVVLWHKEVGFKSLDSEGAHANSRPNIYYIILDAYARADVLKEVYDYDNKDFINYLTHKGFFVAEKSSSNYCQTALSMGATLNFDYLDGLAAKVGFENKDRVWVKNIVRHNRVFSFLKQRGYITVTFDATGWEGLNIKDSDIFYKRSVLTLFEQKLLDSTPIPLILSKSGLTGKHSYDLHRKKILYAFDKVEDLCKQKGPFIAYAHILAPHQPFVFGENGENVTPDAEQFSMWNLDALFRESYKDNYLKQLIFVNKRVEKLLDKIMADSTQPPIIILQADHGPSLTLDTENEINNSTNFRERMGVLNAYYLPGAKNKGLYSTITPVNTFRVVFNDYFGTDYPLLKDKNYFSTWLYPYKFIDVTDKVRD